MSNNARTPGLQAWSILAVAGALSIGWGIRGNYGHEIGAMFPGALAALVACLASGREDWQKRWPYFALFGGLGWGFGGSISYMQVIAYTHSGHRASQVYGFAGLFLIGLLWAGIGGAATSLAAAWDRQRLNEFFRPLTWALCLLAVLHVLLPIAQTRLQEIEGAMRRQDSVLYWFDADWISALVLLVGMLAYDLWDRRFARSGELLLLATVGTALGGLAGVVLRVTGLGARCWPYLVRPQGDVTLFPAEKLPINWPDFVPLVPQHLGWMLGLLLGIGSYFARRGEFRHGSRLLAWMCLGWLGSFVLFPTLLGLRLTPPRSDDWAGILGVLLGILAWCRRERLPAVAWAALCCGLLGGCAFAAASWLKMMMLSLGHPGLAPAGKISEAWRHYQSANWHSFLEQSYGWGNGVAVACTLGFLARWLPAAEENAPRRRAHEAWAVLGALPVLVYLNQVDNVQDWTKDHGGYRSLPLELTAPWFAGWKWSALGWFSFFYLAATVGFVVLLARQLRRPLAMVPAGRLGRGQLAFFLLLWSMVLGNFAKALTGFDQQRLLTEGVILLHAVLLTGLVLVLDRKDFRPALSGSSRWARRFGAIALALVLVWGALPWGLTWSVRQIYGDTPTGHAGLLYRFGPEAAWRTQPVLRGEIHR